MNLREFYRTYGLELIPVAMEDLTLSKCVWDGGWLSKPSFNRKGMPNYITNAFVKEGLMTQAEADTILNGFRSLPKMDAQFADLNIELEIEDANDINIPGQITAKGNFDFKKVKKFSFKSSKGINMPNNMRIIIDKHMDEIKEKHWDEYRKGLRGAYMITELYYGEISITIDSDLELDFEADINDATKISTKLKIGRLIEYTFKSNNVPFAMRLNRLKHFES